MFARQLRREIATALAVKVIALALLFALFFAPANRPHVDANATAQAILSERAP